MSQLHFSIEEQGYSRAEVERYISMLQGEYTNAVEWSNEIEKQFEEYKSSNSELEKLKKENEKLLGDCRLLASKLRNINSHDAENISAVSSESKIKADEITRNAEIRAQEIIDSAYKSQEQIISDISGRIIESQNELSALSKEKEVLSAEIEKLENIRQLISERISKARELLNF